MVALEGSLAKTLYGEHKKQHFSLMQALFDYTMSLE